MGARFRQVVGAEIDDAYAIYLEVFAWLNNTRPRRAPRPCNRARPMACRSRLEVAQLWTYP